MYVLWIALGVYDEGHGHSPGDLLLSRGFAELRFGRVENFRLDDVAAAFIQT